jgi:hypothetical protein
VVFAEVGEPVQKGVFTTDPPTVQLPRVSLTVAAVIPQRRRN